MSTQPNLLPGDPAPWFHQRCGTTERFTFDVVAGRYLVLCFFASAGNPQSRAALDAVAARRHIFDDTKAAFFGVSLDPADEKTGRVANSIPGLRFFWDFDGAVSKLYGAIPPESDPQSGKVNVRRQWLVLDPTLRVMKSAPFAADGSDAKAVLDFVESLPPPSRFAGVEIQAPILVLPCVFEANFCESLIAQYEKHGGEESGFMREIGGRTVVASNPDHKRRKDHVIADQDLIRGAQARFMRRVVPEIQKAYQFNATRMERYIVSCYAAEDGGHFRPHRDNTTRGTAHRRFAVSINLNDDFDGGEVGFPEYGPRTFKAPTGGAVVFSCSLLHTVTKVTRGRRYAFLPFLYDDAAAKIRNQNIRFLGPETDDVKTASV